jgi:hypothetical protein
VTVAEFVAITTPASLGEQAAVRPRSGFDEIRQQRVGSFPGIVAASLFLIDL